MCCNTKNARTQPESASSSGADVTHDAGEWLRTLCSVSSTVRLRPDVDTVAVFDRREQDEVGQWVSNLPLQRSLAKVWRRNEAQTLCRCGAAMRKLPSRFGWPVPSSSAMTMLTRHRCSLSVEISNRDEIHGAVWL